MRKKSLFMLLCSMLALLSCKKEQSTEREYFIPITGITINQSTPTTTLTVGESVTLQVTVTPNNATNNKMIWSSDNETVATVSETGVVTAIKAGDTKIYAKSVEDNSVMDECVVSITDKVINITDIILNLNELTVEVEQIKSLSVTVMPENATHRNVTWSSSDETIATVSKTGSVTGLKVGKTTIRVASDINSEKFALCEVTVTEKSIPATDMWMKTTKLDLKSGESGSLNAVTIPTNATNQEMVWSSDDESVATVDAKGLVTGINAGTTTIWVKWGGDNSIKDKCVVTVLIQSSYVVGDLYPDNNNPIGVVFWKDPTNPAKGKIISLSETISKWALEKVQRDVLDENDGMVNMKIIKSIPSWSDFYPAFKWCSEMGDGWYLPAKTEMKAIYDTKEIINAAIAKVSVEGAVGLDSDKDYWTSTESSLLPQNNAITIQFYKGFGGGGAPAGGASLGEKEGKNNTRAIFKFDNSK